MFAFKFIRRPRRYSFEFIDAVLKRQNLPRILNTGLEKKIFDKNNAYLLAKYSTSEYTIVGECSNIYGKFDNYDSHEISNSCVIADIKPDSDCPFRPRSGVLQSYLPRFKLYFILAK